MLCSPADRLLCLLFVLIAVDRSELACTYAALILHDDGIAVTAEKISSLLSAAKVEVEPYWPGLFERALKGRNVDDLLLSVGGTLEDFCCEICVGMSKPGSSVAVPLPASLFL